ncbi:hypothetical protein [Streptomyces albiflavescens]|nr:hypothetical protein [Streptomyces albiflavescens]
MGAVAQGPLNRLFVLNVPNGNGGTAEPQMSGRCASVRPSMKVARSVRY